MPKTELSRRPHEQRENTVTRSQCRHRSIAAHHEGKRMMTHVERFQSLGWTWDPSIRIEVPDDLRARLDRLITEHNFKGPFEVTRTLIMLTSCERPGLPAEDAGGHAGRVNRELRQSRPDFSNATGQKIWCSVSQAMGLVVATRMDHSGESDEEAALALLQRGVELVEERPPWAEDFFEAYRRELGGAS